MSNAIRYLLQNASPATAFRVAVDGLGVFCVFTIVWEKLITVQLSEGPSMYPTFNPRGDYLLINRAQKHGKGIAVGDVVRFYHPSFLGMNGAKRVLGMPGDFVCKDPVFSTTAGETQEMIQVPPGHVYLAGDNLPWSRDSRNYGPVPLGLVNGKIIARVWPPSQIQWVQNTLQPLQEQLE